MQATAPQQVPTEALLRDLNARWDEAFNSQQPTVVAAFYDDEATVMPSGAAPVTGGKAIVEFWRNLIGQGVVDHKIDIADTVVEGNLAMQRGFWSAAAVNEAGERQEFKGSLQLVFRRQIDGHWKTYTHIWN
jgi:ketosteroid isomerase-like protein